MYGPGPFCLFLALAVISTGVCTQRCKDGNYMKNNTSCVPCKDRCLTCNNQRQCVTCKSPETWGISCTLNCSRGCEKCSSGSNCTTCSYGYYKSEHNSENVSCEPCQEGCDKCSSQNNCTKCFSGYYYESGNNSCLQCQEGCAICISPNNCISCLPGYYKAGHICNSTCIDTCQVDQPCIITNGTCNGCKDGWSGSKCDTECRNGCTVCDQFNDTCLKGEEVDHRVDDVTNIAMTSFGTLLLLVIVGASTRYIVMRKRKPRPPRDNDVEMPTLRTAVASSSTNRESMEAEDEELALDPDSITSSTIGEYNLEDASIYYTNVAGLKRCRIPVDTLQDYVAKRTNDDIKDEFQKLPKDLTRPCIDALLPGNKDKNRYKRICPYDVSRVKLSDGASDFINANYIDGYNHHKTYIASQGPTANTMDEFVDFWRMVWQEKVEKIVMLTNLIEDMKMKCEKYWPNAGTSHMYGDVTVTCLSEDVYADYITKTFTVTQGTETRSLHHLHFTAWPDKGVPDDTTSLIEFRQKVESTPVELGGPVVVHCSAGVGRTGTYLALDILTKEGIAEKSVDIFGCVNGLRSQRVAMVQTWEQYSYLHNSVVHALTYDCEHIHADMFQLYMSNTDTDTLCTQIKVINSTGENMSEKESDAVKWNKTLHDKNRKRADVPGDRYRPKLYLRRIPGASDYINATFVNSFTTKNRYIVAQTPLPDTVVDFLNLVFQENCSCIVSMDADISTYKHVGLFLPAIDQTLKHETFQIRCSSIESTPQYILRKLTIQNHGMNWFEEKTVNHFQFTCWTTSMPVPNDPSSLLTYIQDVGKTSLEFTDMGPILIHCLNGAEKSGLFCAVSVLIQKMELEHAVSVVNTVRQVKARRRGAIPNKEQYIFCHQCVIAYLQMFDLYSNFSLQV